MIFLNYKELKSLYYGNNEVYAQEYLNRFNSDDAVKMDFNIGTNQAFFLQNTQVMTMEFPKQKDIKKQPVFTCLQNTDV